MKIMPILRLSGAARRCLKIASIYKVKLQDEFERLSGLNREVSQAVRLTIFENRLAKICLKAKTLPWQGFNELPR